MKMHDTPITRLLACLACAMNGWRDPLASHRLEGQKQEVFACLAYTHDEWRGPLATDRLEGSSSVVREIQAALRSKPQVIFKGTRNPSKYLAGILCAFNPTTAFQPLDPGIVYLPSAKIVASAKNGCGIRVGIARMTDELTPSDTGLTSQPDRVKQTEAPSTIGAQDTEATELRNILAKLVEKDIIIADKDKTIAEKDRLIAAKDRMIDEKDKIIATVVDAYRDELIEFLRPLRMGLGLTKQAQRETLERVELFVERFSTLPQAQEGRLGGSWRLIYTDAPGILNLGAGLLSELSDLDSIREKIDSSSNTCDYVIRYRPSNQLRSMFQGLGEEISEDRLEQRLLFSLEDQLSITSPRRVAVKFKGTQVVPLRLLGGRITNDWAPALGGSGPLSLPFGSFDVLYNDGRLRITRDVAGGHISVTERVQGSDSVPA